MKLTKKLYEEYLNELGAPEHYMREIKNFGKWLRRCDPIAFQVGYQDWRRENEILKSRRV